MVDIDVIVNIIASKKDFFDALQKIIGIIALIIGAVWGYFRFVRGRTYKPRLEVEMNVDIINRDASILMIIGVEVKNVGLSKFVFNNELTSILIFPYKRENYVVVSGAHSAIWSEPIYASAILKNHRWIESGEIIKEQILVALPPEEELAWQVKSIIISNKGIMWESSTIIKI